MKRPWCQNLFFGQLGSDLFCSRATRAGYPVTQLDRIRPSDGHGPQLVQGTGGITLPDIRLTRFGYSFGAEVKAKTKISLGRLSGEVEHGIDQSCYDAMRRYDREIEPVFLVVVELFWVKSVDYDAGTVQTDSPWDAIDAAYTASAIDEERSAVDIPCDAVDAVDAELRAHNCGMLTRRVRDLGVRVSSDNGQPMVYFPRSQLQEDCLAAFERHVTARDRPRAKAARMNSTRAVKVYDQGALL